MSLVVRREPVYEEEMAVAAGVEETKTARDMYT